MLPMPSLADNRRDDAPLGASSVWSGKVVHLDQVRPLRASSSTNADPATAAADDARKGGRAAGGTTDLSIASDSPVFPPPARQSRSASTLAALACSLLLHAAVGAAIVRHVPLAEPGIGGVALEAVSVDFVSLAAIESLSSAASAEAGGSPDATPPAPATEQIDPVDPPVESQPASDAAPAEQLPDPAPRDDAETTEPGELLVQPDPKPTAEPAPEQAAAPGTATAAANATIAREASVDAEGAAGASAGDLARYAMEVRLAIGKVRPRHASGSGRTMVRFSLSEAGEISEVVIAQSSGHAALDTLAAEAIRQARMPKPPAGTRAAHLTFQVPFEFKRSR